MCVFNLTLWLNEDNRYLQQKSSPTDQVKVKFIAVVCRNLMKMCHYLLYDSKLTQCFVF